MKEYRRILERAAHGQLPHRVDAQTERDFPFIQELYEAGCLAGHDVSSKDHAQGGAYMGLYMTQKGRAYLQRILSTSPSL